MFLKFCMRNVIKKHFLELIGISFKSTKRKKNDETLSAYIYTFDFFLKIKKKVTTCHSDPKALPLGCSIAKNKILCGHLIF